MKRLQMSSLLIWGPFFPLLGPGGSKQGRCLNNKQLFSVWQSTAKIV